MQRGSIRFPGQVPTQVLYVGSIELERWLRNDLFLGSCLMFPFELCIDWIKHNT
jgi:hypothetical protein